MNGPQHYLRAEELLADITRTDGSVDYGDGGEAFVAAAQVHATLALAAATASAQEDAPRALAATRIAWREATEAVHGG